MGTAPSPAPPSLNPLNLAVTFKDGPVVVTDPTLAWLSEAQVSEDETVGVGVNEDEYNGELHLTRNSPAVSSLSIVIVIASGGGAYKSNHEGCNMKFVSTHGHNLTCRRAQNEKHSKCHQQFHR